MSQGLDYSTPGRRRRLEPHWALFFVTYGLSALAGLFVSPWVEVALWGRPGDEVVFEMKVASIAILLAASGILYVSWRRHWIVARWLLATIGAFTSFAGAYIALFILF